MCQTFATLNSNVAILPRYGRIWYLRLFFIYSTFLSPLTSLIDFFLSPHNLSLSQPVFFPLQIRFPAPPSTSNVFLSLCTSNQTQKSSFFSLCTSNQTPIPSSKQNPEMESSQTKRIFMLSEKEQRNQRWR